MLGEKRGKFFGLNGAIELRQYKNDSMESLSMFVLKLPRFLTRLYGEEKSAAISNQTYIWSHRVILIPT